MSNNGSGRLFGDTSSASALDGRSSVDRAIITPTETENVLHLGGAFARRMSGAWLLISGGFQSGIGDRSTENVVRELLRDAFGYPNPDAATRPINVLLSSFGGHLDSAYTTVLYLSTYTQELNVYVPARAKSASTLLALGSDNLYMSVFGELGPLDTQIPDPRNPTNTVSALDCYQSVDYVRDFGFKTITAALPQLVYSTERRIPVTDLLATATTFAIGAIEPVLGTISALDLGGWGRSLRIGERYARNVLRGKGKYGEQGKADDIATKLVYGYTHHPFPIDINEATRIGLDATLMDAQTYDESVAVVNACRGKDFVGFISDAEVERVQRARAARPEQDDQAAHVPDPPVELVKAEIVVTRNLGSRQTEDTGGLGGGVEDVVKA